MNSDLFFYVKPELIILVPVLFFIGALIKKIKIFDNKYIPVVLGGIGVFLSFIFFLSFYDVTGFKNVMIIFFSSVTQGILAAGLSVYVHQIIKQMNILK